MDNRQRRRIETSASLASSALGNLWLAKKESTNPTERDELHKIYQAFQLVVDTLREIAGRGHGTG